jgi:hypothetical protein
MEPEFFIQCRIESIYSAIPDFSNMAKFFPFLPIMVEKIPLTSRAVKGIKP